MTLQRVTASPIVSQGGECMSSFYDEKGTMVLACSGHLRFAAATSDAIRDLMRRFEKSPGFLRRRPVLFQRSLRRRLAHLRHDDRQADFL